MMPPKCTVLWSRLALVACADLNSTPAPVAMTRQTLTRRRRPQNLTARGCRVPSRSAMGRVAHLRTWRGPIADRPAQSLVTTPRPRQRALSGSSRPISKERRLYFRERTKSASALDRTSSVKPPLKTLSSWNPEPPKTDWIRSRAAAPASHEPFATSTLRRWLPLVRRSSRTSRSRPL